MDSNGISEGEEGRRKMEAGKQKILGDASKLRKGQESLGGAGDTGSLLVENTGPKTETPEGETETELWSGDAEPETRNSEVEEQEPREHQEWRPGGQRLVSEVKEQRPLRGTGSERRSETGNSEEVKGRPESTRSGGRRGQRPGTWK